MGIEMIVMAYAAILVVIYLHELGHLPTKGIKFQFFPPMASARRAHSRIGGLLVNIAIFVAVYYYQPEHIFLQLVGMVAWIHFMLYAVVGSIAPEPIDHLFGFSFWDKNKNRRYDRGEKKVNLNTNIFDDVDNANVIVWWVAAIAAWMVLKDFYVPILQSVIPW